MEYIGIIVCHERIFVGKEMAIGYKKKEKEIQRKTETVFCCE